MKIQISKPLAIYELGQRANQEDAIFPKIGDATTEDQLFIVCDGMGGHEHGEVASNTIAAEMARFLQEHPLTDQALTDALLLEALEAAYQALDAKDGDEERKMGTTLCFLYIHKGGITLAHIGDSRIYHVRTAEKKLIYQSRDHSLVYDLYQMGEITYDEMAISPKKNIITRAIQPGPDNRERPAIVHVTDIEPGDCFYLCSDGMLEHMTNDELCQLLSSKDSNEDKCAQLVEATQHNKDNHSAYLIYIDAVTKEVGDASLPNDEQTSKDNALNIKPLAPAIDVDDVAIVEEQPLVATPIEEAPVASSSVRNNVKPSSPKSPFNPKWLLLLVVVVVAFAAFFYVKSLKLNDARDTKPQETAVPTSSSQQDAPNVDARKVERSKPIEVITRSVDREQKNPKDASVSKDANNKKDKKDIKNETKPTEKPTTKPGDKENVSKPGNGAQDQTGQKPSEKKEEKENPQLIKPV